MSRSSVKTKIELLLSAGRPEKEFVENLIYSMTPCASGGYTFEDWQSASFANAEETLSILNSFLVIQKRKPINLQEFREYYDSLRGS